METKQGKVAQVTGNGHYDGQYGRMYKFEISMENGDNGQYLSKTQDQTKFKLGENAYYTIESKDVNGRTFYSIKPSQDPNVPQPARGGGGSGYQKDPETEKRITRMSVLKVASDLVIHGEIKLHGITKIASILERYVLSGEDSMAQIYDQTQPKSSNNIEDDGLPF